MPKDSDTIEQAVSRTVRESLERLQRAADELHHAVADVISACSSRKPANVLPPMLRAQTAAAALAASLDILVRFISTALQPAPRPPRGGEAEAEALRLVAIPAPEPAPAPTMPPRSLPVPMSQSPESAPTAEAKGQAVEESVQTTCAPAAPTRAEPASVPAAESSPPIPSAATAEGTDASVADPVFQISELPIEEQELHRRANRVAKVSMQDIKMLRPDQVRVGQENRDICVRLRDEIEKAHKEYDRRFRPILGHPVDYFYYWMVQILGGGDPERLGEYPYRSPVVRR